MKTDVFDITSMADAGREGLLNGNSLGDFRRINVVRYAVGTIQAVAGSGSWSSAVLTIERSNDGDNWAAMDPTAVTLTAAGMTSAIDLSGIAWLRVRTSTVNGAALLVKLVACLKGDA